MVAWHLYSPACDVRSGTNSTEVVVVFPCVSTSESVMSPLLMTSSPLGPIHTMSGTCSSPLMDTVVQVREYVSPAVAVPCVFVDTLKADSGTRNGKKQYGKFMPVHITMLDC